MRNKYNYKHNRLILFCIFLSFFSSGCKKIFDARTDIELTPGQVFVNYSRILSVGYGVYTYVPGGFNRIGGALLASASDEAEFTNYSSSVQRFNLGSWDAYNNPDDQYAQLYKGIRAAALFLENTVTYKQILARDTFSVAGKQNYDRQVNDIGWMRGEMRFLRAWFYFELVKRYGGVPLVTTLLTLDNSSNIGRSTAQEIFDYIATECDAVKDSVRTTWIGYDVNEYGRATKGAVLALKSRALLYQASPLFNPDNTAIKWENAAEAAREVIALNSYSLDANYQNLFIAPLSRNSPEVIFFRHYGNSNNMETVNYPIGTPGGQSGSTPSQNLVDSYEKLAGWTANAPYANRDPRLGMSIVTNQSTWNGRAIQLWAGGIDGKGVLNASKTGYYLKKFLSLNLSIGTNATTVSTWIHFRYAEILLNYAEAMNEAYGPTADPKGYGLTAIAAINGVRDRAGVKLPALSGLNQIELRAKIQHERRVELAFEEHRFWDVRRWKIAESTLGAPLMGVNIIRNADNSITYTPVQVESRVFSEKMYLYPIPMGEINKSKGVIQQNPGW